MIRNLPTLFALVLFSLPLAPSSWALDGNYRNEIILSPETDYYGFDFKTLKKVSLDQCQSACLKTPECKAFTYNEKAKVCFLKSDFAKATPFKGATSGRIASRFEEEDIGKAAPLSNISQSMYRAASSLSKGIANSKPVTGLMGFDELVQRGYGAMDFNDPTGAMNFFHDALALNPADSDIWRSYSEAATQLAKTTKDSRQARDYRSLAINAALNAYSNSRSRTVRAAALSQLAHALENSSRFRQAIDTFKLALSLHENPVDRDDYRRLLESHGFRMINHSIDADLQNPRICVQFSEDLKSGFGDYASFIRINQQEPKALDVSGRQICVEGLKHGTNYQLDVREGLPADNGEQLLSNLQLDIYVQDRTPGMRFSGNNYVLPANNRRGIPLVSVNADEAELALYRINDRSLAQLVRGSRFLSQIEDWQLSDLTDSMGSPVWKGSMSITPEKNREVVTAIPIDEALPDRKPGVYLMTASVKTINLSDYPSIASQWFVISDIGLTTFSSTKSMSTEDGAMTKHDLGGMQVFARSLESAAPLKGIDIQLIARNNEILGTGTSDETGMVTFDAGLLRGSDGLAPAVLTAANDEDGDFVFLDLTRAGFDLSDRGVTGRPSPEGVDVYAWTERGVYRPGEEVHVSALARDAGARSVDDLPLTFVFLRPDGVEAQRLIGSGKALGGYAVDLPLVSNAKRGGWRVQIFADPKKPALGEVSFLVEDFTPDRTDMTITPDSDVIVQDEKATGKIEGRYLYGAPAAGLGVSANLLLKDSRSIKGYDGYLFGLDEEESTGVQMLHVDSLQPLDAKGEGHYEFILGELSATTRPQVADLVISMSEGSGRAIERRAHYRIEPQEVMLGIKPQFEDKQVSENSDAQFQLIAVNPDTTRASKGGVDWSLVKIERQYQWYRDGSSWYSEAVDLESKVADGQVDLGTGDPAKLSLPVEWGRYRLTLGDTTSIEFQAGWASANGSLDTPDGLELALDKPNYKAGETAKLKVTPRFAGKLLLAIGTDSIQKTLSVDVPAEGATLDIPVEQDWGAGAYLLANLYRPSDKGASRNPMRAIGVAWLGVSPQERALSVSFDPPKTIRPHERMVVPVKVEGIKAGEEAYVNVALVDEGILNLTRYKTPNPVGRYFGQRRLGVDIRDLYGRLIDGSNGAFGALRTGGDGGGPQMDSSGKVPTQELVAFVSGIVRLDENGAAEVAFDIPQFNGTARLMATAWTKNAIGGSDEDAIIRDPIVVHVSLPKVLAPRDESRAIIELTNLEAPEGDYFLELITSEALSLDISKAPETVTLNKDKMVSLTVPVKGWKEGMGDVTVKLSSTAGDGLGILYDAQVPVRSGVLPSTTVAHVPLAAAGGELKLDGAWLTGLQKHNAKLSVSVNEPGTYDVASLLMQLDRYPYGCAEQITSRALPLLYAKELAFNLPEELASLSGKAMQDRIQKAIDKLLSYQSDVGGFSLWGDGYIDDPWLTAYATDFLTRAREQGFNVPAAAMKQALQNIKDRLAYQSDLEQDSASVSYGLYDLARNRMASAGDLRYYLETKLASFDSPFSRAQLGAALALYGDRSRAERAFDSALMLAEKMEGDATLSQETSFSFSSLQRDVAGMLALASEVKPAPASLEGIKALARRIYNPEKRLNTQEQAWMVLAARAQPSANEDLGIIVNGTATTGPLVQSYDGPSVDEAPVLIVNNGDKPLEALVTTVASPIEPLPAGGNGFAISRSYHKLDGSPISVAEVKQNERFVVVVNASQLEDVPSRLMISDLLPAGLEVENPHLIQSAQQQNFNWLPKTDVAHVEFRDDRVLAAISRDQGGPKDFSIAYIVRAVSPGSFMHPAAVIEDMYRPEKSARTASGWMNVIR
nr:alpha-2-macroglobulin family protein [uncultured Cohaesibacter sp.]